MPVKLKFPKNLRTDRARDFLSPYHLASGVSAYCETAASLLVPAAERERPLQNHYLFQTACIACADLPSLDAWLALRRVWMLGYLDAMTVIADPDSSYKLPDESAGTLLGLIALGEDSAARWLALHLQAYGSEAMIGKEPPPSELLACALEALASGDGERLQVLSTPKSLGEFRSLFTAWNDPEAFAGALVEALDFHAKLTRPGNDFSTYPLDVWPLEITAIRAIRKRQGLPMPAVEHDYCASPFFPMDPPDLPPFEDEDFTDIAEVYLPPDFLEKSLAKAEAAIQRTKQNSQTRTDRKDTRKSTGPQTLEEFEALLLSDDRDRADQAAQYAGCMIVDWREEPETVVAMFEERLPPGRLIQSFKGKNQERMVLEFVGGEKPKSATVRVEDCGEPPAMNVVEALCKIIRPEFDPRVFTFSAGSDTLVLYIATPAWWRSMEKRSKTFKTLFKKW